MHKTMENIQYSSKLRFIILNCILFFLITAHTVFPASDSLEKANKLWWNGEYGNAEKLYEEAAHKPEYEWCARVQLATHYRSICNYQSAIEQYLVLLSNKNKIDQLATPLSLINDVYIPLAESYYYVHNLEKAEDSFRTVLSRLPDDPRALFGLGRVLFARDKIEKAEETFRKSASLDPDFPGNHYYLAKIAWEKKDHRKAISYYRKALQIDYHQVELMYFLGDAYAAAGIFEDAFRQFHRLKNIDSDNSLVLAKINEVKPHLTRKEEEIITAKSLEKFKPLKQVSNPEKIPLLRIGLNTVHQGKTIPLKTLSFVSSGPFNIVNKDSSIFSGQPEIEYSISLQNAAVTITAEDATTSSRLTSFFFIESQESGKSSIIIKKIEYARGFAWAGIEDRQYRGRIEVSVANGGFTLVNEVNLEEYLYSVVPSEMMLSFPDEALKAQAVIARSFALYRTQYVRPHREDGFDLCDSQHCQVYKGASNEWEKTTRAVDETRGEVLYSNEKITSPLYHSNCGGHTQSSKDLKGWGDVEYLTGVVDASKQVVFPTSPLDLEKWIKSQPSAYCSTPASGNKAEFRWFRVIPINLLQDKINRHKKIDSIKSIIILKRNPSGHVHSVMVSGTQDTLLIEKEHEIRRLLGLGPLRSNLFWIETKLTGTGVPQEFIIYGGGWGHGVGMCQSGAGGMARRGASYQEILKHYYKNTEIRKLNY